MGITREQAFAIAEQFRALGISDAHVTQSEGCQKLPNGKYGPIVEHFSVVVKIEDQNSGNAERLKISEPCNAADVMAEMHTRLRKSASRTQAAVATEKFLESE